MGYRPPKGVRPPQLEGKRTGRPIGSLNWASAWRDAVWGFMHADDYAKPPTAGAGLWQAFAEEYYYEVQGWLEDNGMSWE
jgi:hypothetical protein